MTCRQDRVCTAAVAGWHVSSSYACNLGCQVAAHIRVTTKTVACLQGNEYFQKEYERLDRIISSGAVSPEKLTEVAAKASVLTAFIPSLNEAAAGDKAAAEEAEAEE